MAKMNIITSKPLKILGCIYPSGFANLNFISKQIRPCNGGSSENLRELGNVITLAWSAREFSFHPNIFLFRQNSSSIVTKGIVF
jgi:hypothetical protein